MPERPPTSSTASQSTELHKALASYRPIDLPYDLFLRRESHAGSLNIFSLFPFVTTLSDFSDESQIKAPGANTIDAAWNMFRKMIWIERNLDRCQSALELLKGTLCDEAPVIEHAGERPRSLTAFNTLFSSMAAIRG